MARHNGGRSLILLRHGSKRKGKQHLRDPGFSPIFFLSLLSVPLSFLGVEKEVKRGQQIVQKDVGVHKEDRQL
jgi:hypothetical protein